MRLVILAIIIILILLCMTLVGLYFYYQKNNKTKPNEVYHVQHPTERFSGCNTEACNAYIRDNVIVKDEHFQTGDSTPCKDCKPYFNYAWSPQHGLAYSEGGKWISCGTKEQCYDKLKRKT